MLAKKFWRLTMKRALPQVRRKQLFFSVTLEANIPTLKISIPLINRYYNNPKFVVICPASSLNRFINTFHTFSNVTIVSEASLISLSQFTKIATESAKRLGIADIKTDRLGWYYQQALKLSFLLSLGETDCNAVMWDADTIPLTRIRFFDAAGNYSFQYGSLSEFNQPYFDTLKNVLPGLPTRFLACTIQFFSCTRLEQEALIARLGQLHPRPVNQPWALWISEIMIDAVLKTHRAFSGSLFSEQELVGLSNMLTHPTRQVPLKHLRWGIEGRLSNAQLLLARMMGFVHLTYENPNAILSQSQGWKSLVQLMHKELRHFYRSR